MSPIIPPREDEEDMVNTTARLPAAVVDTMDFIGAEEKEKGYSRNDIMIHLIRYAAGRWIEEAGPGADDRLKRFLSQRVQERERKRAAKVEQARKKLGSEVREAAKKAKS